MGINNQVWFLAVFLGFCVSHNVAIGLNETERHGKALSVFQVVRFPNTVCVGSNGMNGTCYTSSECLNRNGANGGSCANGFGVCCTFVVGCGSTSSENCTFFKVTGASAGLCNAQICKANPDVCQLRLDFNNFIISGPNTDPAILNTVILFSNPSPGGKAVNAITRCLTDTFVVTSPGSIAPPVICGNNNLQHMYVDASDACNNLNFNLGSTPVGSPIVTRSWNIKVTQISCFDAANLAPKGCTEYFTGTQAQTIQTYNYVNKLQIADQRQTFCFRQELNQCGICFFATLPTDFAVSGTAVKGFITNCCNYGTTGMQTNGFDCLSIPGATTITAGGVSAPKPNAICGKNAGLVTSVAGTVNKSICTHQLPFMVTFNSDSWTYPGAGTAGFLLGYTYRKC